MFKSTLLLSALVASSSLATAQEYVSPTQPPQTGRSPGVKIKLISADGPTKTYAIIFAPGDEILSGLQEFAAKYNVQSAHFTAIGDARSVHGHIAVATEDGMVHGGHLLEAFVEPTLEVMMTTEPVPLYKKKNAGLDVNVIDPDE